MPRNSKVKNQYSYEDLDFAKVDLSRQIRKGVPEVIYAPGKNPEQIVKIMKSLSRVTSPVIVTRADKEVFEYVFNKIPTAKFYEKARIISLEKKNRIPKKGKVTIITAGTSDQAVAHEALQILKILGNKAELVADVGVAGIHRLLRNLKKIRRSKVIIVIAGMDGALASVVSGLVRCPVIAVPTSVGYGASFKGIAALLTMMNCCSPGISVVNIDNGFGAAYFAHLINR